MPAIPVSAEVESQFNGKLNGDRLQITLYAGHASDGYKSDFQRRPARWIEWVRWDAATGKRAHHKVVRYGGNRFDKGVVDYAASVTEVKLFPGVEEL
jgi:hypothetical protein